MEFLKRGYSSDGYYLIHIGNTVLTVYCDMNSEAGSAWTLIMSYALENIKMSEFKRNPLQVRSGLHYTTEFHLEPIKYSSSDYRGTCFVLHGAYRLEYKDWKGT